MIKKITQTFLSFKDRGGIHIFASTILLRIIQFVLGVLIIRFLTKEDYGNVSYSFSIIQLLVPFSGLGLHLALLHFGPNMKTETEKIALFGFTVQKGIIYSFITSAVIFLFSGIMAARMPGAAVYLKIFSLYIISYFLFYVCISFIRIKKENRKYAASLLANSILVFVLSMTGVILFGGKGYAVGFIAAPAVTGIILLSMIKKSAGKTSTLFKKSDKLTLDHKEYIKYGIHTGLGSIASQMAWQMDTIMLGLLLAESTLVATYKVASLIPFSLIFIPSVFMQTDFVYIAERYKDGHYLLNYYKKYCMVFLPITAAVLGVWYLFNDTIVLLFGQNYVDALPVMNILMINVFSTFLFRVPLGNILAAVGKAKWNSYSAVVLLVINLGLNYVLIPKYGVFGAACATVSAIGLSSVINVVLFFVYLRSLKTSEVS